MKYKRIAEARSRQAAVAEKSQSDDDDEVYILLAMSPTALDGNERRLADEGD